MQEFVGEELLIGWVWVDNWYLDEVFMDRIDGWVYVLDEESLKWLDFYDIVNYVNYVR